MTKVTANLPALNHSVSIDYNFGESATDAIELFGDDVVLSLFRQAAVVNLQSVLRRYAVYKDEDGNSITRTSEEVADEDTVANWKPGVSTRSAKSPTDKAMDLIGKMSDAERLELLASLSDE